MEEWKEAILGETAHLDNICGIDERSRIRGRITMDDQSKELIASNLTVAFFSVVEPLPAYLGKERRKRNKPPEGLEMRNPCIAPSDVFGVSQRFKDLLARD